MATADIIKFWGLGGFGSLAKMEIYYDFFSPRTTEVISLAYMGGKDLAGCQLDEQEEEWCDV